MNTWESWDREYARAGIPSSFRDQPSGALVWTLANWRFLTGCERPAAALDVGCGTGRNACYLASQGLRVLAFDASPVALAAAQHRGGAAWLLRHDLRDGLPAADATFDLVTDIFVYKHLVDTAGRARYREELARVLKPRGRLLLSLAEPEDGYYGACPELHPGRPRTVLDPIAGIASVLFTLDELQAEFAAFRLEMVWHKQKPGRMHGAEYVRRTLASIWVKSDFQ